MCIRDRWNECPSSLTLQTESEETRKFVTKNWNQLFVHEGLVYLKDDPLKPGEPPPLRLLLPRGKVNEALRLCHAGSVGGHFGVKKTIDQVRRRFYWTKWKEDTSNFVKRCEECTKYHRGKLKKQGALKPVIPGAPYESIGLWMRSGQVDVPSFVWSSWDDRL